MCSIYHAPRLLATRNFVAITIYNTIFDKKMNFFYILLNEMPRGRVHIFRAP